MRQRRRKYTAQLRQNPRIAFWIRSNSAPALAIWRVKMRLISIPKLDAAAASDVSRAGASQVLFPTDGHLICNDGAVLVPLCLNFQNLKAAVL